MAREAEGTPTGAGTGASRLGLALSGGGFRASFFHIGTLAALADRDMLRHVEVISTVSGGSIVGALYYVKLRELLATRYDRDAQVADATARIGREDYVALIAELAEHFLAAVQTNIRLRVFASLRDNLRMWQPSYSRSDRIATLYDELLYGEAGHAGARPRLRDLRIEPMGGPTPFVPDRDNPNRGDKAPILLINATSLNTGRNWRFEAKTMGEPPPRTAPWFAHVSTNAHLARPPAWEDMTPQQQDFRLGSAVAASAAVPFVFPPLAVSELYSEDTRVQLVDGGVHDNQGVAALDSRGCSDVIVSDASGQLDDRHAPRVGGLDVLRRTNSILMARIREEQLVRLYERLGPERIMYLSLRAGLDAPELAYLDRHGRAAGAPPPEPRSRTTPYGVDRKVQERLSRVRTDLDSFSDREAYALMADGYAIARGELDDFAGRFEDAGSDEGASPAAADPHGLPASPSFRAALAAIADPANDPELLTQLGAARHKLFRILHLRPWLWVPVGLGLLGGLALLAPLLWALLQQPLWLLVAILLLPVAGALLARIGEEVPALRRLADVPRFFRGAFLGAGAALLLWWLSTFWRHTVDRWVLAIGRLRDSNGPH